MNARSVKVTIRLHKLAMLLALLFFAGNPCAAQLSNLLGSSAAQTQPQAAIPPDGLGRETPRGTILGFIRAAQEEKYALATQYFQPVTGRRRATPEDEQELALQLLTLLNQRFAGTLDLISRDPQGRLDDGLPPDEERVSSVLGGSDAFPIFLVRVEDSEGRKLWYFSRKTLEEVPQMYDSLQFPELEKQIPDALVKHRFLSMPIWQWIGIVLFIPAALLLARVCTLIFAAIYRRWRKSRGLEPLPKEPVFRLGPVTLALAVFFHYEFVSSIGTSILYRLYYRRLLWVILSVAVYWVLIRVTRFLSARIVESLSLHGRAADRSIVSLVRRFTEVIIFIFIGLLVLYMLGVDVTTALAGVGIGGLALGLGAQKTFENMFGGVSILLDKVIQVGDTCKIGTQVGVVEDIGLRSTRIRTFDRTMLSIPNGVLATVTLENYRFRDKFLIQQTLRLRYDLAPDHVRYVLEEMREVLRQEVKIEEATSRVRLLRFSDYSIDAEIFAYVLVRDYADYLAVQENILLQVMQTLDRTGAAVALPSQTTMVTQDSWVDPEKRKAAEAALNKMRDPGVPGAPGSSPAK